MSNRPSVSMRREVFDHLYDLAKRRNVSLAGLLDGLAVAELEREGIRVSSYKPHRRRDKAARKPQPAPTPRRTVVPPAYRHEPRPHDPNEPCFSGYAEF